MNKLRPFLHVSGLWLFLLLMLGASLGHSLRGLSYDHFLGILTDPMLSPALLGTLGVALVATLLSNSAGATLALLLIRSRSSHAVVRRSLQLPVIMPHLVVTVIVVHLFSQTGVASRLSAALGFIAHPNEFPLLVFDRLAIGVTLVYLYKQIPFVAMICLDSLRGISSRFGEVAANLGATPWQIATRVYLPLLRPTLLATTLITFAFAFGAFEVPFLLGTPAWRTLPVEAYMLYVNIDPVAQQRAMAINILISVFSFALAVMYSASERLWAHFRNEGGIT